MLKLQFTEKCSEMSFKSQFHVLPEGVCGTSVDAHILSRFLDYLIRSPHHGDYIIPDFYAGAYQ